MGAQNRRMPGALGEWLDTATKRLSAESAARVRDEISEHFESAREDALASGSDPAEASIRAFASLGDARAVNRRYRKVLLTQPEARTLARIAAAEIQTRIALEMYVGLSALFLAISVYKGDVREIVVFIGVILVQLCYLRRAKSPIHGRALRYFRLAVTAALPFGMSDWGMFVVVAVLMAAITLPIELRRATLRRKLPVDQWPARLFG